MWDTTHKRHNHRDVPEEVGAANIDVPAKSVQQAPSKSTRKHKSAHTCIIHTQIQIQAHTHTHKKENAATHSSATIHTSTAK